MHDRRHAVRERRDCQRTSAHQHDDDGLPRSPHRPHQTFLRTRQAEERAVVRFSALLLMLSDYEHDDIRFARHSHGLGEPARVGSGRVGATRVHHARRGYGAPNPIQHRHAFLGAAIVLLAAVSAVELLDRIHAAVADGPISPELLALDSAVTDCNAAIFDVANDFHGVICGCHEILRRQGLLEGYSASGPLDADQEGRLRRLISPHNGFFVQYDYSHKPTGSGMGATLNTAAA